MSPLWAGLFAAALGVAGLGLVYGGWRFRQQASAMRGWALAALAAAAAGVWETWLLVSGTYLVAPHLLGIFNGVLLALGPCLWLQARAAAGFTTPTWVQVVQFAPFTAHGALLALFLWPLPTADKLALATVALGAGGPTDWIGLAKLAHLAIYAGLILFTVKRGRKRLEAQRSRSDFADLSGIAVMAAALGATALGLIIAEAFAPGAPAGALNTAGSLTLAGLAVAIAVRSLGREARAPAHAMASYARSGLDPERLAAFARRIDNAMSREALHADPDLTLDRLAAAARLSPHQVSQTLNQALGQTFYRYVNARRVEAAKVLLAESDISVLDAAMQAGFSTKATFNKAFKAATERTPSEFRSASR